MKVVKEKSILVILYIFLGVFVFNHVAELIDHNKDVAAYCCELEEIEEANELEHRLKSLGSFELVLITFHTDFFRDLLPKLDGVTTRSVQRAFFPHSLHVPIYLDKGVIIV